MVELKGVEPLTLCLQSRCSDQLSYSPKTTLDDAMTWNRAQSFFCCALGQALGGQLTCLTAGGPASQQEGLQPHCNAV